MRELLPCDFASGSSVEFPLSRSGEIWYLGWDIPGYWAIDAAGKWFADFGAHGCCLTPSTSDRVIRELEASDDHATAANLRKLVGRKPKLPDWIVTALSAGWTPPSTFDRDQYE